MVSLDFQWFYWISDDLIGFPMISLDFQRFIGFPMGLLDVFIGFPMVSLDFQWFYWISCDFIGFPMILLDFRRFGSGGESFVKWSFYTSSVLRDFSWKSGGGRR